MIRLATVAAILLIAGIALAQSLVGGSLSGGSFGDIPQPAYPRAVGEASRTTQGAFATDTEPAILVVGNLTDDAEGCTGSGATQACPKCDETGDNECSLREALQYAQPRVVVCNVSGTVELTGRLRINSPYLTFDASTCPGPLIVANNDIEIEATATQVVLRNLIVLPAGEFAEAQNGTDSATAMTGGDSIDGISIKAGARDILIDRASLGWACDENLDIGICDSSETCSRNVTVQRSWIGPGVRSTSDYPCHSETNHAYGGLLNNSGASSAGAVGINLVDNVWALLDARSTWQTGGKVRHARSLYYSVANTNRGMSLRQNAPGMSADLIDNLFIRTAEDSYGAFGYCSGGSSPGAFCESSITCAGGGTCVDAGWDMIGLNIISGSVSFADIYLDGNVFVDGETDTEIEIGSPVFDGQWDFASTNGGGLGWRPNQNPVSIGDTSGGGAEAPGASFWDRRRDAKLPGGGAWVSRVDASTNETRLLDTSGSAHQTPVDDEWRAIVAARGEYDDQAFLPSDPRAYPTYSTAVPWTDADTDGMDDAWEASNCAGDDCDPMELATVSRCAGYRWIQCWAHRDDFGEGILQVAQDGDDAYAACENGLDDDGDTLTDLDDPGCRDGADPDETNYATNIPAGYVLIGTQDEAPDQYCSEGPTYNCVCGGSPDYPCGRAERASMVLDPTNPGPDEMVQRIFYPGIGDETPRWYGGGAPVRWNPLDWYGEEFDRIYVRTTERYTNGAGDGGFDTNCNVGVKAYFTRPPDAHFGCSDGSNHCTNSYVDGYDASNGNCLTDSGATVTMAFVSGTTGTLTFDDPNAIADVVGGEQIRVTGFVLDENEDPVPWWAPSGWHGDVVSKDSSTVLTVTGDPDHPEGDMTPVEAISSGSNVTITPWQTPPSSIPLKWSRQVNSGTPFGNAHFGSSDTIENNVWFQREVVLARSDAGVANGAVWLGYNGEEVYENLAVGMFNSEFTSYPFAYLWFDPTYGGGRLSPPAGGMAWLIDEIVVWGNKAPVVNAGTDISDHAGGTEVQLAATVTDDEGDDLTYEWTFTAGTGSGEPCEGVTFDDDSVEDATFTPANVTGTCMAQLCVEDDVLPVVSRCDTVDIAVAQGAEALAFSDDFNRSDSTSLGSDWDEWLDGANIASNKVTCNSAGVCTASWADYTHAEDQYCSFELDATGSNDSASCCLRVPDTTGYFLCGSARTAGTSNVQLHLVERIDEDGEDFVNTVSGYPRTETIADGTVFGWAIEGDADTPTVSYWINPSGAFTSWGTATYSSTVNPTQDLASSTGVGVRLLSFSGPVGIDNWKAGDVAPATPPDPACGDGADNDGDGFTDFAGSDPGCTSSSDTSERGTDVCDNGSDDYGDGLADYPADPGCTGPTDTAETNASVACDDGVDNDSDGSLIDELDPGCTGATLADRLEDTSELNASIECDDGSNNDGGEDSDIDWPADDDCTSPADDNETEVVLSAGTTTTAESAGVWEVFGVTKSAHCQSLCGSGALADCGSTNVTTDKSCCAFATGSSIYIGANNVDLECVQIEANDTSCHTGGDGTQPPYLINASGVSGTTLTHVGMNESGTRTWDNKGVMSYSPIQIDGLDGRQTDDIVHIKSGTVENSWLVDPPQYPGWVCPLDGAHSDGIQLTSGGPVTIDNNFIRNKLTQTSTINIQGNLSTFTGPLVVTNNTLDGPVSGPNVYVEEHGYTLNGPVTFTDNVFLNNTFVDSDCAPAHDGWTWSGNVDGSDTPVSNPCP